MQNTDRSLNVGEDDLHAFVDGQLASERHREVMAYLAVHPDAADRVSSFFRHRVELAGLREQLTDREVEAGRLDLEAALCQTLMRQRRARRVLAAGSLTGLVLATAMVSWLAFGSIKDRPALVAGLPSPSAVEFGRDLLAKADLVGTEPGDPAVIWLQAHLAGTSLEQPHLESLGLRFLGGNVLKNAKAPAIRLVYADAAERKFHLFIGVAQSGAELAALLVPEDHISLTWRQDPLVFSLLAPKDSAQLTEIMRSTGGLLDPDPISTEASLSPRPGDSGKLGEGTTEPAGSHGFDQTAPQKPL